MAGHPGFLLAKKILRTQKVSSSTEISVLDLGGGHGRPWKVARLFLKDSTSSIKVTVVDEMVPDNHVLEDLEGFNLQRARGDLMTFCAGLDDNSIDVVILLDVLEHLPKHTGWMLLYEITRIAKHGVGISVPNGFDWQPPSQDNPYQAHISSWRFQDFRAARMPKIIGCHGLRSLTGRYSKKKYGLKAATAPIYAFEVLLGRLLPQLSAKIWAETFDNSGLTSFEAEALTDKFLD